MKQLTKKLSAIAMTTVLTAVSLGAQSAAAYTWVVDQLPEGAVKMGDYYFTANNPESDYQISESKLQFTKYYLQFEEVTGFDTLTLHMDAKNLTEEPEIVESADFTVKPVEGTVLPVYQLDDATSCVDLLDFSIADSAVKLGADTLARVSLLGWNPEVSTQTVYAEGYDENSVEPDDTVPSYELLWSGTPRTWFTVGSVFECTKYHMLLAEKWVTRTVYYDVSDYLVYDEPAMYETGDQIVTFRTSFRTLKGSAIKDLTKELCIHVAEIGELQTTATVNPGTTTETTATTVKQVTTSYQDDSYTPFYTDPFGETRIRGTNAPLRNYLYIVNKGRTEFALGEAFDPVGLKVFLVEDRSWNDVYYDVTGELNIETDYDPNTPGEYTVYLSTDYAGNEGCAEDAISYTVQVNGELTTGPADESNTITYSTLTVPQTPYSKSDVNNDGRISVADAVVLTRYLLCDWEPDDVETFMWAADLWHDNKINVKDLTLLKYGLANQ